LTSRTNRFGVSVWIFILENTAKKFPKIGKNKFTNCSNIFKLNFDIHSKLCIPHSEKCRDDYPLESREIKRYSTRAFTGLIEINGDRKKNN